MTDYYPSNSYLNQPHLRQLQLAAITLIENGKLRLLNQLVNETGLDASLASQHLKQHKWNFTNAKNEAIAFIEKEKLRISNELINETGIDTSSATHLLNQHNWNFTNAKNEVIALIKKENYVHMWM